MYTTRHLQILFDVSSTTVRNWCREFSPYLSTTTNPEAKRQRQFTDDDLGVLALVAAIRNTGGTYEAMHTALKDGRRGELPDITGIVPVSPESTLITLQQKVTLLEADLAAAQADNLKKDGQIALLKEQLAEAQQTIRQMEREAGKTLS